MSGTPLTLVAIHGNGGGAFRFERVLPHVPEGIVWRALTLPGFDGSAADPTLTSVRDYADWIVEHIAAESRPRVLLGTGIGGSFALDAAQRHAERIDGLLLHAPVGTRLDTRLFPRLMRRPAIRRLGRRLIASPWTRPLFRRLLFREALPRDYVRRFFEAYRHCAAFEQMFEIIHPAWFDGLRPVELPAALLWGERERVLHVDQLEDYRRLLDEPEIRRVPGWDHFPMIEQPEEFIREVIQISERLVERTPSRAEAGAAPERP